MECGSYYCQPGQQCSRSGACQPLGSIDCGAYYCQPGQKCGKGWRACLAEDVVDCGPKHETTCPAGHICWVAPADYGSFNRGKLYCPTAEDAAESTKQIKEIAERKRQERLAEIARKKEEAEARRQAEVEARKEAEEERRAEAARKKREADARRQAEAEAKRQVEIQRAKEGEAEKWLERQLQQQASQQRKQEKQTLKPNSGPTQTQAQCKLLVPANGDAWMRADVCNPSLDLSRRKVEAIALGIDPNLIIPISSSRGMATPPTSAPANGVWRGLASQATVAPILVPKGVASMSIQTVRPVESMGISSTFNATPVFAAVQNSAASKSPLQLLTEFYQSPLGSSLLDVAAAAGGAAVPYPVGAIGDANTAANVMVLYQKGDHLGIAEIAASEITTKATGAAGGPVGAAVAQGALDVGTKVVAPWLGNIMYEVSPSTFAP